MIDWWGVIANSIWIAGSALALASVSYASWQGHVTQQTLRAVLGQRPFRLALDAAGWLFCLGMAATAGGALEIIVWLTLSVLFLVQLLHDRRSVG